MRFGSLIALALLVACGGSSAPQENCPSSVDLQPWVWRGAVQFSQCNRTAEAESSQSGTGLLWMYRGSAKTVTLSAQFELLNGSGHFQVAAGNQTGPIVDRNSSGQLSATGEVVDAEAVLAIWGLADSAAPIKWRVSDVRIE